MNLFGWWWWRELPDQKLLMEVFRRLGSAHMRLGKDELGLWKAWVKVSEGFWMVVWDWNGLKLRKENSIFEVSGWMFNRGSLAWNTWKMNGTPSPIYKEGMCMVRWEVCEGLLRNDKWSEACLRMILGIQNGKFWSGYASPTKCFWSLAPNKSNQGVHNNMLRIWLLTILGNLWFFHMGSNFVPWGVLACKLTSIYTTIP